MMKPLRIAIIGCGRISSVYCQALHNIGSQVQLVLAFDKVLARAEALAGKFPGCQSSDAVEPTDVAAMLRQAQVDLVHILLPHHLHCRYAVAALDAGIHVLTEKPIATTLADAQAMMEARDRSGKQLGVIFQNRFIDGVAYVRDLLQSGAMGKLQGVFSTLNWFRPPSYYECDWKGRWETEGGGVVIDQAIHSIDLVRYLTGEEAVKIVGHTARRVLQTIEVEDEADAAIILSSGAVYSFFACNYYATNSPIRIELCCEKATALLTCDTMELTWRDGSKNKEIIAPTPAASAAGENYWGCFHEAQIRACYQALRDGKPMFWSAEDATKTLEIVLGIYQSARTHEPVYL